MRREFSGIAQEYFLIVGQNQATKGHEIAVRAFASAKIDDVHLVLVQRLAVGKGLLNFVLDLGLEIGFDLLRNCIQTNC